MSNLAKQKKYCFLYKINPLGYQSRNSCILIWITQNQCLIAQRDYQVIRDSHQKLQPYEKTTLLFTIYFKNCYFVKFNRI